MGLKFTLGKYRISVLGLLLVVGSVVLRADNCPGIKSMRTVVYEPVLKDTSWVTGKVVDYIVFVKYDSKGRKIVENRLKPDGSPHGKLVYLYNDDGQVELEIYATADKGVSHCWDYTYDEKGRINCIVSMNGQKDTLGITSALYDDNGKVLKRFTKDYVSGELWDRQIVYSENGKFEVVTISGSITKKDFIEENITQQRDTIPLKRIGAFRMSRMQVVKNHEKKNPVRKKDGLGYWTERFEGCGEDGEPRFIIRRKIEYTDSENDWAKIPLRGKVKTVSQRSYVAVPKGSETVDKGEKKGEFFVYEFDENGWKIREEAFSDAGKPTGKIVYEHDEKGNLSKETHYTPTGVLRASNKYGYDKEGRLKSCSAFDEKEQAFRRDMFRYDIEGNRVQETGYTVDGTKDREFRYIYDSYGQQIERKVLVKPAGDTSVYPIRRAFNFQGRVVGEEYLLLPGVGRNTYTYRYNTKGEVISGTEWLDGQPGEMKYVYKFYNDERGNWKIRIKYVDDIPVVYEEREYVYYE